MNGDCYTGESGVACSAFLRQRRLKRRENCGVGNHCLPPWWVLIRWFRRSDKKSKRRGIAAVEENETGKSPSFAPEESGDRLGPYRNDASVNLVIGFGLVYLISTSTNELKKMTKLRKQMEVLLQNFKDELQSQKGCFLSKPSASSDKHICLNRKSHESFCTKEESSLESPQFSYHPVDSKTTLDRYPSLTCNASIPDSSPEGRKQLEAELEVELDRLQLHLDSEELTDYEMLEIRIADTAAGGSSNASLGNVVDIPDRIADECHGVSPNELERRLHELLQVRQQERIQELEEGLECLLFKLKEKEKEVSWWKDTAKLISQHAPETSCLIRSVSKSYQCF